MGIEIPDAVKLEHEALHAELVDATRMGGKVGEAAREVAGLLHPHFLKEEAYALPPLGLLTALAEGKVTARMRRVLTMTDALKADLPEMLEEHHLLVEALHRLIVAAQGENRAQVARFAESLRLHAAMEEQVLYPAAILVGEYVRARLGATAVDATNSELRGREVDYD